MSFLQHIAGITAMLQQSLQGLLLEVLQISSVDIIWKCLQTQATIDKTRDSEASVGQVLVKPYIDEVCVLLNKAFIQQMFIEHCSVLDALLGVRGSLEAFL